MKRREFLRSAAATGAAAALGPYLPDGIADAFAARLRLPGGSILDLPASSAPIDTVVVCMMENRSFDHYLGWLASDETYLEAGRSRYGRRFRIDADNVVGYADPTGAVHRTFHLGTHPDFPNPYRGCDYGDPGHGWNAGRAQRDGGFLAAGSGNDVFALGYFEAGDLPFYAALARRFTVLDRYHCSILGPTFPNREYLHSGQSGGLKTNAFPPQAGHPGGFPWPTIWDRLAAAGVPARYYHSDLPVTLLWGQRLLAISSPMARYFEDAAAGQLPNVVFVDPAFLGDLRTDEHPHGDVRDGQRFVFDCIDAFVASPHWERGLFILTYDEWGGFFDHRRPPRLRDDRASRDDQEDFGQAGFRVPTRLISPWARPGFVDHALYDHASILRFLEWRFLGAPPRGRGGPRDDWFLTKRDRYAHNIGESLLAEGPDPEFDPGELGGSAPASPPCGAELGAAAARTAAPMHDLERGLHNGYFESVGLRDVPPPYRRP
jgi:phospholipase C